MSNLKLKLQLKVKLDMTKLLQFAGYKLSWFGLILAPVFAVWPVLLYWFWSMWRLPNKARLAVVLIAFCGVLMDSLLLKTKVFDFVGSDNLPFWMWVLWGCFALVLVQVLAALLQHWWLAAIVGAVSGPLAYWGGANLGGQLVFADIQIFMLTMAPCWGLLLALIVYFRFLWSENDEANHNIPAV